MLSAGCNETGHRLECGGMLIAMWGMSALGKHEHVDSRPDCGINNFPGGLRVRAVALKRRLVRRSGVQSFLPRRTAVQILMKELVITKDQKLLCKFEEASIMIKKVQKIVNLAAERKPR